MRSAAHSSRRVALVYRLDPMTTGRSLPVGVHAKIVRGRAVGVALVTCPERGKSFTFAWGRAMASCVHGVLADWKVDGMHRSGFYLLRRDVDARWLGPASGLLLPGSVHGARFRADVSPGGVELAVEARDGQADVEVTALPVPQWPGGSLFQGAAEAKQCLGIECGAVQPLGIVHSRDAWFESSERFPAGCAEFDSAMVIQDLVSLWRERHNARRSPHRFAVPATSADVAPA